MVQTYWIYNFPETNHEEILDTVRWLKQRIIRIGDGEESQIKGPENIFNQIIEENFLKLKKEMSIKGQETQRTSNIMDQKKISLSHDNKSTKQTEQDKKIKNWKQKNSK